MKLRVTNHAYSTSRCSALLIASDSLVLELTRKLPHLTTSLFNYDLVCSAKVEVNETELCTIR